MQELLSSQVIPEPEPDQIIRAQKGQEQDTPLSHRRSQTLSCKSFYNSETEKLILHLRKEKKKVADRQPQIPWRL